MRSDDKQVYRQANKYPHLNPFYRLTATFRKFLIVDTFVDLINYSPNEMCFSISGEVSMKSIERYYDVDVINMEGIV